MFNILPEPFLYIDVTQYASPLVIPKTNGTSYIINPDLIIELVNPGKIVLPRVTLSILIENINDNINEKYDEMLIKMSEKCSELLKKLNQEPDKKSYGFYYLYSFMAQSCKNGHIFKEEFSAIWSTSRIINHIDTPFTTHY